MSTRLRRAAESWARSLLRRDRVARAAGCLALGAAALVLLAAAAAAVRMLLLAALLAALGWGLWLVGTAWRQQASGEDVVPVWPPQLWLRLRPLFTARLGRIADRRERHEPVEEIESVTLERLQRVLDEQGAAVAALRHSVDALGRDVVGRQERLAADSDRLTRDLSAGIESMRALVAQIERGLATAPHAPALPDLPDVPDVDAAYREIEADLRLEAIEAREQTLAELEERLTRREQELAVFVAQAQGRLD